MRARPSEGTIRAWARLLRTQRTLLDRAEDGLKVANLPPLAWYDVLFELERCGGEGLRPAQLQKELMLAQYDQGADIAFNVAGQAGLGLLDAAQEKKRYAIGVDSDQYLLHKDSDPEKASYIVTSMLKNVGWSLFRAIKGTMDGTIKYGAAEALGIKEGGVGVADNENYTKLVSAAIRGKIKDLEKQIVAGKIKVDTAFGK
jgi:basic membrane lipoprotein Med (substrate-binding protein (PBP1-ABC) superfamily)